MTVSAPLGCREASGWQCELDTVAIRGATQVGARLSMSMAYFSSHLPISHQCFFLEGQELGTCSLCDQPLALESRRGSAGNGDLDLQREKLEEKLVQRRSLGPVLRLGF